MEYYKVTKMIEIGTKTSNEGWLKLEKRKVVCLEPDMRYCPHHIPRLIGYIQDVGKMTNIEIIEGYLYQLNGYKVKITIEVLDAKTLIEENRITKIPEVKCISCLWEGNIKDIKVDEDDVTTCPRCEKHEFLYLVKV